MGQEIKSSKLGGQTKSKPAAEKAVENVQVNMHRLSGIDHLQQINDLMKQTSNKDNMTNRDRYKNAKKLE